MRVIVLSMVGIVLSIVGIVLSMVGVVLSMVGMAPRNGVARANVAANMQTTNYIPSPRPHVREQVDQVEAGGTTDGVLMQGRPIVLVSMRGARTGALRKVPLMRVEHAGSYALVGSQGGSPKHPLWVHNLRAHPEVTLQDGPRSATYLAREVSGSEREEWWRRAVEAFPPYADYRARTSRTIPLFVLEPA